MNTRWSLAKSARNGAIFGCLYGIYKALETGLPSGELQLYFVIGSVVGTTCGGLVVFPAIAALRNNIVL